VKRKNKARENPPKRLAMFLVPCSCGTSFAVSEDYDRHGGHLRAYLVCPNCGKRHDPRNRVLQLGYEQAGFWKVDGC
jgi:hydrogenase maturation factor HypF (carbamoyltransferase family)